jgi:hypothetical protein
LLRRMDETTFPAAYGESFPHRNIRIY